MSTRASMPIPVAVAIVASLVAPTKAITGIVKFRYRPLKSAGRL